MAEQAGQRAADLARQAERAAIGFRNVDALDQVRLLAGMLGRKAQEPLARAVDRDLLGVHLRTREREVLVEHRAKGLRDVQHLVEALHAAHVEPVPELLHPHLALALRHADAAERNGKLGPAQADERRLRRRDIALERRLLERREGRVERSGGGRNHRHRL
jgi:hypothetical protein